MAEVTGAPVTSRCVLWTWETSSSQEAGAGPTLQTQV